MIGTFAMKELKAYAKKYIYTTIKKQEVLSIKHDALYSEYNDDGQNSVNMWQKIAALMFFWIRRRYDKDFHV